MSDTATQAPGDIDNPLAGNGDSAAPKRTHRKPKTVMQVVTAIPESVRKSPTQSQWTEIMKEVVSAYDSGTAKPGDSLLIREYATNVGAKKALEKLVEDGHPWAKELGVQADAFRFDVRGAIGDDGNKVSHLYVTLLFGNEPTA